jgi:hypothetical protein
MDGPATDSTDGESDIGRFGWKWLGMTILLGCGRWRIYRLCERLRRLMTNGFFMPLLILSVLALAFAGVLPALFGGSVGPRSAPLGGLAGLQTACFGAAPVPPVTSGADVKGRPAMMTGPLNPNGF